MIDHHPPKAARMCRVSGHQAAERGGEESVERMKANLPVYLANLSRSRGYLVSRCISMGMISFSCKRRHRRLLWASYRGQTP
jgi:hypothetical protein